MNKKEIGDGLNASFIISQAKSRNRPLHPYTAEKAEEADASSDESPASAAPREDARRRKGRGMITKRSLSAMRRPIRAAARRFISARSSMSALRASCR